MSDAGVAHVRFSAKVGQIQIGPKLEKSGIFKISFSVHFGSVSQNEQKTNLKKSRICPVWSRQVARGGWGGGG